MYENHSRYFTVINLIKYLNENNDNPLIKENMFGKIKFVLKEMDDSYKNSHEKHKELLFLLLIMTVKYHCLSIGEYELAFSLWREKIDSIYDQLLLSGFNELNEATLALIETEMISAYRLNNPYDIIKQIVKNIDISNLNTQECHSLYTKFIFSGEHIEAFGYFIKNIVDTEHSWEDEMLAYICPFFSKCLSSSFQNSKGIAYGKIVDGIARSAAYKGASKSAVAILSFYSTTISALPDIVRARDYKHVPVHVVSSFKAFLEGIEEYFPDKYRNIIMGVFHDYLDILLPHFKTSPIDALTGLKNTKLPSYKKLLLDDILSMYVNKNTTDSADTKEETRVYKLKKYQKLILYTIYRYQNKNISLSSLSRMLYPDGDTVKRDMEFLMNSKLIVFDSADNLRLSPRAMALIAGISLKPYRAILHPEYRLNMYTILEELFPGYSIFHDVSLKELLDMSVFKELLDSKTLSFLSNESVEFVVADTTDCLPFLGLDIIDDLKDNNPNNENRKKSILMICGIPLITLKLSVPLNMDTLREGIKKQVRDMLTDIKNGQVYCDCDFLQRIDINKFDIYVPPVDIEAIKDQWNIIVGPGIAQRSKVLGVEEGILRIEISHDLKPIIEMSKESICRNLMDKFIFLHDIYFKWMQ